MEKYRLKEEIIEICKGNKVIMRELEDLFNITHESTRRVLLKNGRDICNYNALLIIKRNLNLPLSKILILFTK